MATAMPPPRALLALVAVALLALVGRDVLLGGGVRIDLEGAPAPSGARDLTPYEGLGTWVDAFDYGEAYQSGGGDPPVTPEDVDAMADAGVRTLFIQANRDDERSPGGWVDRERLDEFVLRAHARGMAVVGWYLPTFTSVATDLGHLRDLLDYEVDGHRLDGVGVDIEYTEAVPDVDRRNARLVRLSRRLADAAGSTPVSAIVLPPVLTEVVNPDFWPEFPWAELEPLYDVWLPMSYWTDRTEDSGYRDGAAYHEESHRRLVANLGDPDAPVHGIGGIGDQVSDQDLLAFAHALEGTGAVGGSIYDWATLDDDARIAVQHAFARAGLA